MIDVTTRARVVVVLGRGPLHADPGDWVATAKERDLPLLVLSMGFPVSDEQQAFVARSIDRAFERRVHLEALLVWDPKDLTDHVEPGDEIVVVAGGRDGKRIRSALGLGTSRAGVRDLRYRSL